ncbi:MAG: hypothetical protein IT384_12975 [Deltaproteobacteria bacterium]|nr:hypothetical protein [Deltaproteobacteria bacterium]
MRLGAAALLCSLLPLPLALACADKDGPPAEDAGIVEDAQSPDSGTADAGTPPDSGEIVCPEQGIPPDPDTVVQACPPLGMELDPGAGPPRRGDMSVAVDERCGRVIMFYGDRAEPVMCNPAASDFLTDAWTFDLARGRWAQIDVAAGPAPLRRARGSAVWDPASNRLIQFGGRYRAGTSGAYTYLNDVWAFDPSTASWTELSAQGAAGAPAGRMNSVMVMDAARNRVLIHGGGRVAASGTEYTVDNQTWAFDLGAGSWAQLGTTGAPTPRLFHVAALDRMRSRLFVFAGAGRDALTAPSFFRDLWYLDLTSDTWTEVPATAELPAGRIKGVLTADPARDRLLLFAGHDDGSLGNDNDLWSFDLASLAWTRVIEGDTWNAPALGQCDFPANFALIDPCSPERRESHVFEILGNRAIMHGGRTDCGLANDTWILDLRTMRWSQVNGSFTGMTCFRSGRTDCNDQGAKKCG